mgnify:CR=1 FL=1
MSADTAWTVSKIMSVGFKSLTYCLRVVSGPLLMRKWPVFCHKWAAFYGQISVLPAKG